MWGGDLVRQLSQNWRNQASFLGIDINFEAIRSASKKNTQKTNFLQADCHSLPFKTDSFNFVITTGALEHVASYLDAIREIKRVLKPGAFTLIACGPNRSFPIDSPYHKKIVTRYPSLREMYQIVEPENCKLLWAELVHNRIKKQAWSKPFYFPTLYHRVFYSIQRIANIPPLGYFLVLLARLLESIGFQRNIVILYRKPLKSTIR